MQNLLAGGAAHGVELVSDRYEVGFKAIGKHHIGGFVQQLFAFSVGEGADGREAVGTMCALLFDAVFGIHVEFLSHLVSVIAGEVGVEFLVVTGDGASDARGVGGEDGGDFGAGIFKEEHAETGHPFVSLINHLSFHQACFHPGFHGASGTDGEHRGFVIVAVGTDGIYAKLCPSISVDLVFFCKKWGEINQDCHRVSGHVPASDAAVDAAFSSSLLPAWKKFLVFNKIKVFVVRKKVGTDENVFVAELFLKGLCPRR